MEKREVKQVTVWVHNPPDKDIRLVVEYEKGDPDIKKYGDWETTAYNACLNAIRAELEEFDLVFVFEDGNCRIDVGVPPDLMKKPDTRIRGPVMLQVERQLHRKGFEAHYSSKGVWVIHRPDPAGGYANRGYFDAVQVIRFAAGDAHLVNEAIKKSWASHVQTSPIGRYLSLGGSGMAKKKEEAEEAVKKQVTVKALDGTDVAVSPKQKEMYDEIKERSASGAPVGSDEERLDDPSSIAAMKLATGESPVVVRHKFGARWHYFAKQADLDKAVEKAEAAAAAAKKPAAKKAAEGEGAATGGKKKGPLKKPSEK